MRGTSTTNEGRDHFFRDAVCVVTGGTSGVGRALVRRLARQRAAVAVLARGQDGIDATLAEIREAGARGHGIAVDVANAEQVFAAADEIERELGPIDVWINNAMTTVFSWISDIEPEELRRVTDVCYHGAVWGTQAALRSMVPRDRGLIIQVGSALAYRAIPLQAAYCGGKHAMRAFTDSLRCELKARNQNIQLTMVQLPGLNTPQFEHCRSKLDVMPQPVAPVYDPDVAARGILHAAQRGRREAFVGFPTVKTIIGSQLTPSVADWYLARTAIEGQKTDTPNRGESNLFTPVKGDPGARGPFTERSKSNNPAIKAMAWLGGGGIRASVVALSLMVIAALAFLSGLALG